MGVVQAFLLLLLEDDRLGHLPSALWKSSLPRFSRLHTTELRPREGHSSPPQQSSLAPPGPGGCALQIPQGSSPSPLWGLPHRAAFASSAFHSRPPKAQERLPSHVPAHSPVPDTSSHQGTGVACVTA